MRRWPRNGAARRIAGAAIVAVLLSTAGPAATAAGAPATPENLAAWHLKMVKETRPEGDGCFTARYPRLIWQRQACGTATSGPMLPRAPEPKGPSVSGPVPMQVGARAHFVAETPDTRPIFEATGTFENVQNMNSVQSMNPLTGELTNGAYSLQLNTNFFEMDPTEQPLCAGAPNPASCQGWMQFVFANHPDRAELFIEYWLIKHNQPACPAGWTPQPYGTEVYCRQRMPAFVLDSVPITRLGQLSLTGDVRNLTPWAVLRQGTTLIGTAYGGADDPLNVKKWGWKEAEFNVFGNGFGAEAQFPLGAYSRVRTRINYGGTAEPKCKAQGYTAETNNLDIGSKPGKTPPGPALIFTQHRNPSLPLGLLHCDYAEMIGDTHQITFAGLLYDFQASGDFVEALTASGFEVQTRKVVAPDPWRNASINKSAAVRMGATTVAVCEGTRLVVDGTPTLVPPGGVLRLPSGVTVERFGNVYTITDPSGNQLRTELRISYLDVRTVLGAPATVRGLLGGTSQQLEDRNGIRYNVPVPFTALYNNFGNSWRVSGAASMLSPCTPIVAGNPSAEFYAWDLPPTQRQQAESACRSAGVSTAWIDACTLDVAVLGINARTTYVRRLPPAVNGNRTCNPAAEQCRQT